MGHFFACTEHWPIIVTITVIIELVSTKEVSGTRTSLTMISALRMITFLYTTITCNNGYVLNEYI
jgi:hypothetical protein